MEKGAFFGIMCVDLHIHTTFSDGTKTPKEVVKIAKKKRLIAISITDHDEIKGNKEAIEVGSKEGIEVIPGVEISTEYEGKSVHILGYCIDYEDSNLEKSLSVLQRARRERNPKIVEKLRSFGFEITYEEIVKEAGGGQIGRPHFAKLLVKKGYVKDIDEAFDLYLRKGGPAYVEKFHFLPEQAIDMIIKSGGIPVLAHPKTIGLKDDELFNMIKQFVSFGLRGIEVYYPEHTEHDVFTYKEIAKTFGLIETGGSDFHGDNKPGVEIGLGNGRLKVPYDVVEKLKNIAKRLK